MIVEVPESVFRNVRRELSQYCQSSRSSSSTTSKMPTTRARPTTSRHAAPSTHLSTGSRLSSAIEPRDRPMPSHPRNPSLYTVRSTTSYRGSHYSPSSDPYSSTISSPWDAPAHVDPHFADLPPRDYFSSGFSQAYRRPEWIGGSPSMLSSSGSYSSSSYYHSPSVATRSASTSSYHHRSPSLASRSTLRPVRDERLSYGGRLNEPDDDERTLVPDDSISSAPSRRYPWRAAPRGESGRYAPSAYSRGRTAGRGLALTVW